MKKIFVILTVSILTLFASCSKEQPGSPVTPVDPETEGCRHDSPAFVPAVEPDETTYGNVEHYYCSQCGKYFSDSGCTDELETVILWGSSLVPNAQDFFEYFDSAYQDYGFDEAEPNALIAGLLSSIIVKFAEKSAETAAEEITKKIVDNFMDGDEGEEKKIDPGMQLIADNLSKIEQAILSLVKLYKEESIKEALNEREQKLFYVRNATHPYFMSILNQFKGLKVKAGEPIPLSEEKKGKIKRIVNEWHDNGIYNGLLYDECYVSISSLLHFYTGFWTSTKTIPELYTHVMYSGTPWTHQANEAILMARTSDIITLAESYLMMCYYFSFNMTDVSAEKVNLLNQEVLRYDAALKKHPVDTDNENYTRWIWHKKGEVEYKNVDLARQRLHRDIWHIEKKDTTGTQLEKQLTSLIRKKDDKDESYWWNKEDVRHLVSCIQACTDNYNHHGLTYKQQNIIYEYYRNDSYSKDSKQNNYYNMLVRAGFRNLTPYENSGRLLVLGGTRHFRDTEGTNKAGRHQACDWLQIDMNEGFMTDIPGTMYFRDYLHSNFSKSGDRDMIVYREKMIWYSKEQYYPYQLISLGSKKLIYDVQILSRTNENFEYIEF